MRRTAFGRKPIKELTPIIEVEGQKLVLVVPQLAGISIKDLGPEVATLVQNRNEIVAALDFLLTGV
jgi:toxin CcdB